MAEDPRKIDWFDLNRLLNGNPHQREAAQILKKLKLFEALSEFTPVFCGTIPIDCDNSTSDLDIACYASDFKILAKQLEKLYGSMNDFSVSQKKLAGTPSLLCRFLVDGKRIEIVAQQKPVTQQRAFGHMLAEALLIHRRSEQVKDQIRALKAQGHTTEKSFAILYSLPGDPYEALMNIYRREFNPGEDPGD